jgi:hypothetical protein
MEVSSLVEIQKLIEKNSVQYFDDENQNDLLKKIKEKFVSDEQQMFVINFYCSLHCPKDKFIIDFEKVWKWLGFTRKNNAKRLLEKYFSEKIDYEIVLLRSEQNLKNGRPDEQIFLTTNTFKKFCLRANTTKSDIIHNYYIKLEEILQETINEQNIKLQNKLLLKNNELAENNKKHEENFKIKKHHILIEKMKTRKCVYIAEIKGYNGDEDKIFRKIGSTEEIEERCNGLAKTFKNCIFLEVFECENFREIETNILADENVRKNLYVKPINNHISREVVLLSESFNHNQLMAIVEKYVAQIYQISFTPEQILEKQKLDLAKQKLEYDFLLGAMNNKAYEEIIVKILNEKFENMIMNKEKYKINEHNSKKELLDAKNINNINNILLSDDIPLKTKMKKCAKSKKVQKIDPNNLKNVIKVYNSIPDVVRSPENNGFDVDGASVKRAIINNTIYKGYRWNYAENDNIKPTKEFNRKPSITNTIYQLNSAKTEIIDTFPTIRFMAKKMKMSRSTISNIIKNKKKYNENYYVKFTECPANLIEKYDKKIEKRQYKKSKQVKQINPITAQTIIFDSSSDIYRKYGIVPRTIREAIKNKTVCNGFLWEYNL